MWKLSEPIRHERDRVDYENRIRQLTQIDNDLYKSQINENQNILNNLLKNIPQNINDLDNNYTNVLSRNPDKKIEILNIIKIFIKFIIVFYYN